MSYKVRITEYLDIDVDEELWYCNRCGYKLISARDNYKKGSSRLSPTTSRQQVIIR